MAVELYSSLYSTCTLTPRVACINTNMNYGRASRASLAPSAQPGMVGSRRAKGSLPLQQLAEDYDEEDLDDFRDVRYGCSSPTLQLAASCLCATSCLLAILVPLAVCFAPYLWNEDQRSQTVPAVSVPLVPLLSALGPTPPPPSGPPHWPTSILARNWLPSSSLPPPPPPPPPVPTPPPPIPASPPPPPPPLLPSTPPSPPSPPLVTSLNERFMARADFHNNLKEAGVVLHQCARAHAAQP